MYSYYLEYRFHSYPKRYLRNLIGEVARKFKVKGAIKYKPVPHMTLYGPFLIVERKNVFLSIEKVARKYDSVPFTINNFEWRNGRDGKGCKIIACHINASQELKNLRRELAEALNKTVNKSDCQVWDNDVEYWFHSTIAMNDIDLKFDTIWRHVNKQSSPRINQQLVRITVLNGSRKIEREYDLMFQRWLSRREALSGHLWRKTISRLRELQNLPQEKEPSLMDRVRKLFHWL